MNQDERNQLDEAAEDAGSSAGEQPEEQWERDQSEGRPGDQPGNRQASGDAGDRSAEESGEGGDRRGGDRGSDHGRDTGSGNGDGGDGEKLVRMKEAMLRLQAEMDNREKRLEREMAKARKFALDSLMRDLVQVLDSMDQALSSAGGDDAKSAREGLELTRKQALQVLTSHGLEVLDPSGEKFDPSWHEAMATQPSDEHDPDVIVQVLQKGYRLHERLIRPARVIVAKEA